MIRMEGGISVDVLETSLGLGLVVMFKAISQQISRNID